MPLTARIRTWSLTAMCVGILTLTACGAPAVTAPAMQPSAAASTSTATAACDTLKPAIAEALGLQVGVTESTFTDIASGTQRQGCQIIAEGTGAQIKDFVGVSQQLSTLLTSHGWGEAQPLADGPTGTVIGFNSGGNVGQLTVEWKPATGASCPTDKPIADCTLLPEQKLYTIKLEAAASGMPGSSPSADEALQQAVYTYVMENTSVRSFTLAVDGIQSDVARVRIIPASGTADPAVAYALHQASGWSVLAVGTSFDPAFYEKHAIPASLQLGQS